MTEIEGVIKYRLSFESGPPPTCDLTSLTKWHRIFKDRAVLGQDPKRYQGYGFGNLSMRVEEGFLISGTQTGHLDHLSAEEYALVTRADTEENVIEARGIVKPSSEALSHAAVYALSPSIQFVFHVHSPAIWQGSARLGLRTTPAEVPYGTPDMARAIDALFEAGETAGIFAMAGHEDGIIAFAETADEAGSLILEFL